MLDTGCRQSSYDMVFMLEGWRGLRTVHVVNDSIEDVFWVLHVITLSCIDPSDIHTFFDYGLRFFHPEYVVLDPRSQSLKPPISSCLRLMSTCRSIGQRAMEDTEGDVIALHHLENRPKRPLRSF